MAKQVKRGWLRVRSACLWGTLGLMGLTLTGCPQPDYGVVAMYGVQEAKAAPAEEAPQASEEAGKEAQAG